MTPSYLKEFDREFCVNQPPILNNNPLVEASKAKSFLTRVVEAERAAAVRKFAEKLMADFRKMKDTPVGGIAESSAVFVEDSLNEYEEARTASSLEAP